MIEIYPPYDDLAVRVELWGSEITAIRKIDPLTGEIRTRPGENEINRILIYPKSHYVLPADQKERAIQSIYEELDWWKGELERQGKIVEAQRVVQRTHFDIEMMRTIGYCHGIENYSRHLSGRLPGEAPPISCFSSTSRIKPSRKFEGCITATVRASRRSLIMAFACPPRSTTARSILRNSNIA
jgi:excinuclease ABC subunit B